MKKKIIIWIMLGASILSLSGCSSTKNTEVSILATTDLHAYLPYELTSYIKNEKSKDENTLLVDAGDFLDSGRTGLAMGKYFDTKWSDDIYDKKYLEVPIAKEMKEIGYDTVVLGNHEFIENNKFQLDNMVKDFKKQDIDVLSANTYKKDGKSYVDPYVIKDISTPDGNVKVGILGLTIQEVGQTYDKSSSGQAKATSEGLKDFQGYNGELYMADLIKEANKWVNVMQKENPDIILAVVHSGEESDINKYPGNRIKELAKEINGIDAIVAGHTHKEISQHTYKNKSGEKVIVTQPGKYGECISKINFELEKNNNKWNIVDKSSDLTKFEQSKEDKNFDAFKSTIQDFIQKELKSDNMKKTIRLSDITPFDWDKVYVFKPKTSSETIYKTIGYKWQDIKPANDEDMLQMVFMKNDKVVCHFYGYSEYLELYLNFDKSEYKNSVVTMYPKNNDKFKIDIDKLWLTAHLTHI